MSQDLDVEDGFRLLGGKTIDEAFGLFIENPSERAVEIRFAPASVFNYYVFCYCRALLSSDGRGQSIMASVFLDVIANHVQEHASELTPVWTELREAIRQIAAQQEFYDADPGTFGIFDDTRRAIEAEYERSNNRGV